MSKLQRGALVVVGSMVALAAALPMASAAPLSGAIFTTGADCAAVNLNGYNLNADVYLSGGPSQPGAASLPDGGYYVKVTEPGGAVLGTSSSPVFNVRNGGLDVDCVQLSSILVRSSDGTPGFDLTTNPGDQYKVWVCDNAQFLSSGCKTDSFYSKDRGDGGGGGGEDPPPIAT